MSSHDDEEQGYNSDDTVKQYTPSSSTASSVVFTPTSSKAGSIRSRRKRGPKAVLHQEPRSTSSAQTQAVSDPPHLVR